MKTPEKVISFKNQYTFVVLPEHSGQRLDSFIGNQVADYSRSFLQKTIKQGHVTINGKPGKPSTQVQASDTIQVNIPDISYQNATNFSPEEIETIKNLKVEIIHTHPDFFIINKPAGLMTHKPTPFSPVITLVEWLLHNHTELSSVGSAERPGIIHRLDKDTSGLMIIPRNEKAFSLFGTMFQDRLVEKTYYAVVKGHPEKKGIISSPIGRSQHNPTHMACLPDGRKAQTNFEVLEYFENYTVVKTKPVTGRTHQIRVHLKEIGHPIIGDTVYHAPSKLIKRQALHAKELSFTYNGKKHSFSADLPQDFHDLLKKIS